jgi:hypothetical protein
MPAMDASSVAAERPSRPWRAFLGGGAIGLMILVLTQILTDTQLSFGPWALNGNGALAMPFLGFPLAIYAGWTVLGDSHSGRDLGAQLVSFSVGLILGAGLLGLFFALPVALVTGAVYATWVRGAAVKRSDMLLWITFGVSVIVGALPFLGLFGVALLPGSVILLARDKPRSTRVWLGALLVLATALIVFAVPLVFPAPTTPPAG